MPAEPDRIEVLRAVAHVYRTGTWKRPAEETERHLHRALELAAKWRLRAERAESHAEVQATRIEGLQRQLAARDAAIESMRRQLGDRPDPTRRLRDVERFMSEVPRLAGLSRSSL